MQHPNKDEEDEGQYSNFTDKPADGETYCYEK